MAGVLAACFGCWRLEYLPAGTRVRRSHKCSTCGYRLQAFPRKTTKKGVRRLAKQLNLHRKRRSKLPKRPGLPAKATSPEQQWLLDVGLEKTTQPFDSVTPLSTNRPILKKPAFEPAFKSLGFASYEAYCRSQLWQSIRAGVLLRDACRCVLCGSVAQIVHHQSYEISVMNGTDTSKLFSLCRSCHEKVEIDPSGKKRTHRVAVSVFDSLLSSKRKSV